VGEGRGARVSRGTAMPFASRAQCHGNADECACPASTSEAGRSRADEKADHADLLRGRGAPARRGASRAEGGGPTRTGIPCLTTAARTVIVILQSSRPVARTRAVSAGREQSQPATGTRAARPTRSRWLSRKPAVSRSVTTPTSPIAEGRGRVSKTHGAQSLADEHDAAEMPTAPPPTPLGRDVHEPEPRAPDRGTRARLRRAAPPG